MHAAGTAERGFTPQFWRRWAQVAGCAVLVSLGSAFMFPRSWIHFGVLHGIAVMLILARCWRRCLRGPVAGWGPARLGAGLAAMSSARVLQQPWLNWTGPGHAQAHHRRLGAGAALAGRGAVGPGGRAVAAGAPAQRLAGRGAARAAPAGHAGALEPELLHAMSTKVLFGFHAVTVRLKTAPQSISEIHVDGTRRDARMRQFVERAKRRRRQGGRQRRRAPDAWPAARATRAWWPVEPLPPQPLAGRPAGRVEAARAAAAGAGARRRDRPAQPGRLPARGRRRRRARRGRAQGPRRGPERHRGQGGQRRGRDRALPDGDQPGAHPERAEGARHPHRRHQRRRRADAVRRGP
jgi:hypothetical protein